MAECNLEGTGTDGSCCRHSVAGGTQQPPTTNRSSGVPNPSEYELGLGLGLLSPSEHCPKNLAMCACRPSLRRSLASATTVPVRTLSTATSVCVLLPGTLMVARCTSLYLEAALIPLPIFVSAEKVAQALCGGLLCTAVMLVRCSRVQYASPHTSIEFRRTRLSVSAWSVSGVGRSVRQSHVGGFILSLAILPLCSSNHEIMLARS